MARLIVALLLALGLWLVAAPPLAAATTVPSVESPPGGADVVATSVLAGQVLIGPTCPLARPNPPPGCEDRPYQASISIQTPDGTQEVARIETDEQGLFSIELSPGDYLVVPLTPPDRILPRGEPQLVTLASAATTSIVLHFDSGLR